MVKDNERERRKKREIEREAEEERIKSYTEDKGEDMEEGWTFGSRE